MNRRYVAMPWLCLFAVLACERTDSLTPAPTMEGGAAYPPDSQPLSEAEAAARNAPTGDGVRPLLPLARHLTAADRRWIGAEAARGQSEEELVDAVAKRKGWRSLRYQVTTANRAIAPGETFRALLRVFEAGGAAAPVAVREAYVNDDAGRGPAVRLGDARATALPGRPGQFELTWQAPARERRYSGDLFLVFTVEDRGVGQGGGFGFHSTAVENLVFDGRFHERLSQGSLLVEVGYTASRPARCRISADLFAGERPLHAATWQGEVGAPGGVAPLRFFGKAFHERGYQRGPLTLRNLAGRCTPIGAPGEPVTWEDAPAPARPFVTIEHDRREFSAAPWSGR